MANPSPETTSDSTSASQSFGPQFFHRLSRERPIKPARTHRHHHPMHFGAAVVLCLVVGIALTARAAPPELCPAENRRGVLVRGEAPIVAELRRTLLQSGTPVAGTPDCAQLKVTLTRDDAQNLVVTVVEADGRNSTRTVSEVATAAAWVDSWLLQLGDLADHPSGSKPVVVPPASTDSPDGRGATTTLGAQDSLTVSGPEPADTSWRGTGLRLAIVLEGAASDAGGQGGGLRARLCEQLGPICLGGGVRLSGGFSSGVDPDSPDIQRFEVSAAATLDHRFRIGPTRWVAGGSFGVLWRRAAAEGEAERDTVGPEFGASLRAHIPLSRRWAFSVGGYASVAPFNGAMYRDDSGIGKPPPPRGPDGTIEGEEPWFEDRYSGTPWTFGLGIGVHFSGGAP